MTKYFLIRLSPKLKLFVFFGLTIVIAITTPHLFDGHLFLNKKYAQSVVIFFYFLLAFFLSYHYLKDLKRVNEEKKYSENLLNKSYKHLGVTNRKIDILKDFISIMADEDVDSRNIIMSLSEYLVHSITKSSNGIVRFIDRKSSRTLTEWNIMKNKPKIVKISNKKILNGEESGLINEKFQYIKSTLAYTKVECVFIFDSESKNFDYSFLIILLTQIHSLAILQNLVPYTQSKKESSVW